METTYERVIHNGRPHWRFANGKLLPVVSGGSDAGTTTDPGDGSAPGAAGADGAAAPGAESDQWPEPARQRIDALKQENQGYRQRWEPFERSFGSLNPQDAEAIMGFAHLLGTDPNQALQWMITNARTIAGDRWEELTKTEKREAVADATQAAQQAQHQGGGLTEERLLEILAERERRWEEQRTYEQEERQNYEQIITWLRQKGLDGDDPTVKGVRDSLLRNAFAITQTTEAMPDLDKLYDEMVSGFRGHLSAANQKVADQASKSPTPANGQAVGAGKEDDGLSPLEKVKARLDGQGWK